MDGQSGFYFGQPDNRFVPNFQSQSGGPYFGQSNFGQSQFRPSDYSQQQVFNTQGNQGFQNAGFETSRQPHFQNSAGRSQQSGQYYLSQSDFSPLDQTQSDPLPRSNVFPNRGLSPASYQVNHPASTNRPEFSPFAQTSHNHDPSKPEMFLGQITINNPDPFPDNPGDVHNFNSPRIRQPGQSGYNTNILRSPPADFDSDFPSAAEPVNQDIYEYTDKPTKHTTYNPRKPEFSRNKPLNRGAHNARPSYFNSPKEDVFESQRKPITASEESYFSSNENSFSNTRNRFKPKGTSTTTQIPQTERQNRFSPSTKSPNKGLAFNIRSNKPVFSPNKPHYSSTTEYKPLFDLAPLLEDEIPNKHSYGDSLRRPTNGSEDVEVIKSVEVTTQEPTTTEQETEKEIIEVSKSADEPVQEINATQHSVVMDSEHSANIHNETVIEYVPETEAFEELSEDDETQTEDSQTENINEANQDLQSSETPEYYDEEVEYIDESENPINNNKPTKENLSNSNNEEANEDTEEYEEVEEDDHKDTPNDTPVVKSETFEILTMKPKQTMVKDDNFKEFVDSSLIDNTEPPTYVTEEYVEDDSPELTTVEDEGTTTDPPPILIGQEVVSVVTTKSVVNGTFSIPEYTKLPPKSTSEMSVSTEKSDTSLKSQENNKDNKQTTTAPNSTESWVVVASVQTSRSVSGARFLPFPGVAQEEKKQILSELDDDKAEDVPTNVPEDATVENITAPEQYTTTDSNTKSTESIIDKLDRVQSELSSGFLSGGFKGEEQDFAVLTEMPHEKLAKDEPTTPAPPLKIFTVKSTTTTSTTEKLTPEPPQVTIKKFSPYSRPVTTSKPKTKVPSFETIKMDDLTGLLPSGFKSRPSFKDRKITTTTEEPQKKSEKQETQSRSLGGSLKNNIVIQADIASLLPKGYKPPKEEKAPSLEDLFKNIKSDSLNHLLPSGYKPKPENKTESSTTKPKKVDLIAGAEPVPISAFLPKGYKLLTTSTEKPKPISKPLDIAKPADISAFLPPGFKLDSNQNATLPVKIADISSLLPPGFKLEKKEGKPVESTQEAVSTVEATTKGSFKVVFPSSRPGAGRPGKRLTTPKSTNDAGGPVGPSTPSPLKKWPTRATTEFTGWPTPSTTPFSIEKLLEAQRAAAAAKEAEAEGAGPSSGAPGRTSTTPATTTPTTTTTTMQPTTPGVCAGECDLAATIKIVGGVNWVPELLDHNTKEWQLLANEVSNELDAVYSKSPSLKKWYKGIRIDGFSKGSVLVDFFVELNDVGEKVDTSELKKLFHKSLTDARPGSVVEEVSVPSESQPDRLTGRKIDALDPDMMLGDQPPEERVDKNESFRKVDKSKGKLEIGKFILDPIYTEFIVLPKRLDPTVGFADDNMLLPQWGIAVIVIALASLLFVVIFGVTVLVNRQKNSKAKQPIPLSEDMLRELDKSHMGTDLYLQEHEPPYHKVRSSKRGSAAMLDPLAYPGNPGDSWRSEWGPYYSQYSTQQQQQQQQHYTPDSGRGSQSYTANGNYGYSGSQIYGYNGGGGGGSQNYGYTGEGVRTLYPRRRSDFDSTF